MKLLDRMRMTMMRKQYSPATIKAYLGWVERFLRFHKEIAGEWRHPSELGRNKIEAFLNHLAINRSVAAATQNQAFNAILFLYREVLNVQLENVNALRAHERKRLPVVLTRTEVTAILNGLDLPWKLMVELLYGSGLRLQECCTLRIKDVDVEREQIILRATKGNQDRVSLLPSQTIDSLKVQIDLVTDLHKRDLANGFGEVPLPDAFGRKSPLACRETSWQYLFPSARISRDRNDDRMKRFHVSPSSLQRIVKEASSKAGITKRATCHAFRHSFATHLLEDGYDIRVIQRLLGHRNVKTTMIYTHVMSEKTRGVMGVNSPLDQLK